MERLTILSATLLLLTIVGSGVGLTSAKPCSQKELSVFNEVFNQVNKCIKDSKLNFQIPPHSSLSKTQQSALCKSKSCQEMIGAVDDLDIPRCESAFDKKNVTLQVGLDKFVSSCDSTTSTPSPIKRRKSFESSSSGSGSLPKNRRYQNSASAVRFGAPQQIALLLIVGMLSLALVLP